MYSYQFNEHLNQESDEINSRNINKNNEEFTAVNEGIISKSKASPAGGGFSVGLDS